MHRRCHWLCRYDHSTSRLLTVSSITSTVWVHPGREAAGVENGDRLHIGDSGARESDCAVRRIITAAKKRLQNLLYKPISPLHLHKFVRNFFQLIPNFPFNLRRNINFFYLEWPKGIVSIPVGQPDPTRPISLTLTQTPLPQLTAWSQFIAAALGHSTVWADFVCVSGSVLSWPTRPNGQSDPTRPILLTLTQTPQPQLTAWSQFIAGAWS